MLKIARALVQVARAVVETARTMLKIAKALMELASAMLEEVMAMMELVRAMMEAGQGHDGADDGHGEGGTQYGGAVEEFAMHSSHESMSLDMSLSRMRPAPLLEPCSQCRIERHVGEDTEHFAPMVQVLDVPVPLTMGEVFEVLDLMQQSTVEHLRQLVPQERGGDLCRCASTSWPATAGGAWSARLVVM